MNKIIYIVFIAILFSCKSNSIAQEKEKSSTNKIKVQKPKFGDNEITRLTIDRQDQIAPNTVHLTAVILDVFKNKSICGASYEVTMKVKIKSIVGSGSGIVNMISSGQEIIFGAMKNQVKDFDVLREKTSRDQEMVFVVRESLCMNTSKTVYQIISFKSKR